MSGAGVVGWQGAEVDCRRSWMGMWTALETLKPHDDLTSSRYSLDKCLDNRSRLKHNEAHDQTEYCPFCYKPVSICVVACLQILPQTSLCLPFHACVHTQSLSLFTLQYTSSWTQCTCLTRRWYGACGVSCCSSQWQGAVVQAVIFCIPATSRCNGVHLLVDGATTTVRRTASYCVALAIFPVFAASCFRPSKRP